MIKTCIHCNLIKDYEKQQHFALHVKYCQLNPNKGDKNKQTSLEKYLQNPNFCFNCKEILSYKNKKYKYCSQKCESEFRSFDRLHKYKKICENCSLEFYSSIKRDRFCSLKCKNNYHQHHTLIAYRLKSNYKAFYNNQWFDSSWEVEFAKRLDLSKINWIKNKNIYYLYKDNEGKIRKYYPDFYLHNFDIWIEIKGRIDEKSIFKMKSCYDYFNNFFILKDIENIKNFSLLKLDIYEQMTIRLLSI